MSADGTDGPSRGAESTSWSVFRAGASNILADGTTGLPGYSPPCGRHGANTPGAAGPASVKWTIHPRTCRPANMIVGAPALRRPGVPSHLTGPIPPSTLAQTSRRAGQTDP